MLPFDLPVAPGPADSDHADCFAARDSRGLSSFTGLPYCAMDRMWSRSARVTSALPGAVRFSPFSRRGGPASATKR